MVNLMNVIPYIPLFAFSFFLYSFVSLTTVLDERLEYPQLKFDEMCGGYNPMSKPQDSL
jgi:hypothetical protein